MKALLVVAALVAALPAGPATAATMAGTVVGATGQPLAGALVTVFNEARDRKETVYTGRDGSYAIHTAFFGRLRLRIRSPGLQDQIRELFCPSDAPQTVNVPMTAFPNAQAFSDSLTAAAHATQLRFPDPADHTAFVSQCNYCHQIGNALTRVPRDEAAWRATVARMEGYMALLSSSQASRIARTLHEGFTGRPVAVAEKRDVSDESLRAKIYEWHVGDGLTFVHDADVGQDGRLYGTDEGHDLLWVLDRGSGRIDAYREPDVDLPVGGYFSGLALPLGVFSGKHGPHSLAQGRDGRFWITNALSSKLMSFDPATRQFKSYSIDEPALYMHTIRIAADGTVWFTSAVSNKVGRFDPRTETFRMVHLPHDGFWRSIVETLMPTIMRIGAIWPRRNVPFMLSPHKFGQIGRNIFNLPYGIDVNPLDGSIWYAKLFANKIGRIDPRTLEVKEFDTPLGGPRRPRFDRHGVLWIPSFDDGALMRYDTSTGQFETFKLPLLGANEYEVPYAVNVHPVTGDVWITANLSDRVLRFDPAGRTFHSYSLPTRVTVLRDLVFTAEGHVCSSSSNLPAYGIEDGRDAFICIDPTGGDADRARVVALRASSRRDPAARGLHQLQPPRVLPVH
jgi:virginiamycin B lyase